jgi:hypothetical protein
MYYLDLTVNPKRMTEPRIERWQMACSYDLGVAVHKSLYDTILAIKLVFFGIRLHWRRRAWWEAMAKSQALQASLDEGIAKLNGGDA